jgi:transposase
MDSRELKRVRLLIERGRGAGRRLSVVARSEVVAFIDGAHADGASYGALARELGVSGQTLANWRAQEQRSQLLPVRVSAMPPVASTSIVVHGPRGLRIEGLTLDDVGELYKRLS